MERTVVKTACPLDCPDTCGLDVTVEAGRVVRVDGDRRNPITNGIICGKVRKIADHLYGDARLARPLVRTNAKTEAPAWREASWDEALDLVASRLGEIKARAGGEAILPYHYGGSNGWITEGGAATRFFRRLGATNLNRTFCAAATTAAMRGLYGRMPGVALDDYVHANLIVLWGVNPSATGIHLVPIIEAARARGAKLVVVDPRATPLARRADLHLPIRPGRDLPVALAIARALTPDRAFLDRHVAGYDELMRRAGDWTLARAAEEAGLDLADLERFVALYGAASPAVIRVGWGMERNRNGGSAVAAVLALPAIAGKLGVRGGGYTISNGDVWGVSAEPGIGAEPAATRTVNMAKLGEALRDLRAPRIEAVVVYNCNPAVTAPDQTLVVEELARPDRFVVVHEQVMNDTAMLADVVLPATAFLEHHETVRGFCVTRLFDSPAVATPFGEARSNTQLFTALLERMGLSREGDATTDAAIRDRILAAAPDGARLAGELAADRVALPSVGSNTIPFVDVFPDTVDRKVQLVPASLDAECDGRLYHYQPDPGTAAYPLALISPALATQISSQFGQLRDAPATVELSTADAGARGIASGDAVRVFNERGEVHCTAKVEATLRDGVVVINKGLWRKHFANGYTSNALIPPGTADLAGQAAFNDARVQVARR